MNYGDIIEIDGKEYTIVNDGLPILVKKKEPTYKAGDCFNLSRKICNDTAVMIVQTEAGKHTVVGIQSGNRYSNPKSYNTHKFTIGHVKEMVNYYVDVKPIERKCVFRSNYDG